MVNNRSLSEQILFPTARFSALGASYGAAESVWFMRPINGSSASKFHFDFLKT